MYKPLDFLRCKTTAVSNRMETTGTVSSHYFTLTFPPYLFGKPHHVIRNLSWKDPTRSQNHHRNVAAEGLREDRKSRGTHSRARQSGTQIPCLEPPAHALYVRGHNPICSLMVSSAASRQPPLPSQGTSVFRPLWATGTLPAGRSEQLLLRTQCPPTPGPVLMSFSLR